MKAPGARPLVSFSARVQASSARMSGAGASQAAGFGAAIRVRADAASVHRFALAGMIAKVRAAETARASRAGNS